MSTHDAYLDLTGFKCPMNFVRAKLLIETMETTQVLKLKLIDEESIESVCNSMQQEGHELLKVEKFQDYSEVYIAKN